MTCVVLERLNEVEVGSFALTEAILTVKLELSGNNRVLTPAVHLKGSLGKNESTGIRDTTVGTSGECFTVTGSCSVIGNRVSYFS